MKTLYTQKAVKNMGYTIISVGYCDLQRLLRYEDAFGYSKGIYGWNCDYYTVNNQNVIICTGYRPIKGINVDSSICKKYEALAHDIINEFEYSIAKERLNNLITEFVKEVV